MKVDLCKELKGLDIKFHDFVFRKKLVVMGDIIKNYPLLRVKLVPMKKKKKALIRKVIIYPCDMVPYVRKTLDVIEEMVRAKLESDLSYKRAGDIFYARYGFDLNSIKSAVRMAETAFNRLLSCGLAQGLDLACFVKGEKRSFTSLNYLYWTESLKRNIGWLNLFR